MTPTDTMKALARAVLAGDAPAVAGLIDEVIAEGDLGPGREWLALWDQAAVAWLHNVKHGPGTGADWIAQCVYNVADAFMAERARRLATRKPA
jgi:hypothetical protein